MATATPTRTKVLLEDRSEMGAAGVLARVDKEHKLIRNVKLLGLQSRNPGGVLGRDFADMEGYDYEPAALKEALPMYENAPVNIDHLQSRQDANGMRVPGEPRRVKQRFGKLQNVHLEQDGLYGDIRYLESHPMAPMVLEAAQEMPDVFTMSHHAHGEVERGDGKRGKVTKINQVHSVDLIAEKPGTTTSLFESAPMDDNASVAGTDNPLASGSGSDMAETVDGADGGADPCDAICQKAMEVFGGDMDSKAKLGKLKELLALYDHTQEVLNGTDGDGEDGGAGEAETSGDEAPVAESAACADGEKGKGMKMEESLKAHMQANAKLSRELREQKAREKACVLLSGKGIALTEARIAAVATAKDEAAQKELLESFAPAKGTTPAPKPAASKPRSVAPFDSTAELPAPAGSGERKNGVLAFLGRN